MKRHAKPQRKHYLKSARTPIPRKGITRTPRPASETLRIYGSKARRAFITRLSCVLCYRTPSENAHVPPDAGMMGRKGPYTAIIPLCSTCHPWFDKQPVVWRRTFLSKAGDVEAIWLAHDSARLPPHWRRIQNRPTGEEHEPFVDY